MTMPVGRIYQRFPFENIFMPGKICQGYSEFLNSLGFNQSVATIYGDIEYDVYAKFEILINLEDKARVYEKDTFMRDLLSYAIRNNILMLEHYRAEWLKGRGIEPISLACAALHLMHLTDWKRSYEVSGQGIRIPSHISSAIIPNPVRFSTMFSMESQLKANVSNIFYDGEVQAYVDMKSCPQYSTSRRKLQVWMTRAKAALSEDLTILLPKSEPVEELQCEGCR